jgi:hypothetical protein
MLKLPIVGAMKLTVLTGSCPYCFRNVVAAIHRGDEEPLSGDYGICRGCGGTLVFDFRRRRNILRRPLAREWAAMHRNPHLQALRTLRVA